MGHLNSFLAQGGGNWKKIFQKIKMPGRLPSGGGGMLKLWFDWYISKGQGSVTCHKAKWVVPEKIHTPHPPTDEILETLAGEGVKDSGNPGGTGGWKWKSLLQGSFQPICNLNVQFNDTSVLSDPENSRNILFTYFSPSINDNLSSVTGPFAAENAKKLLQNESSQTLLQRSVWNAFRTHFYSYPRPSAPLTLCNFISR